MIIPKCKLGTKGCYPDGRCHYAGDCAEKMKPTNADMMAHFAGDDLLHDKLHELMKTMPVRAMEDKTVFQRWLNRPYEGVM